MWSFFAAKLRHTLPPWSRRKPFRPRLEALEDRCVPSAGALDTSFGTGGLVSGGPNGTAMAIVVQPDGKIIAGGEINGANGYGNFALARYKSDGSLDSTFGNGGMVATVVGKQGSAISGLALQSDGKIVAVGWAMYAQVKIGPNLTNDSAFAVARYNPNGSLDSGFGGGGLVLTNVATTTKNNPGGDAADAVAIQGDGKIDVFGSAYLSTQILDFALVRYNASGMLDSSFGSSKNGIIVTPNFGSNGDNATALTIQSDGKILLAGYTGSSPRRMALARYTPAGLPDTSTSSANTPFGTTGVVMVPVPSGSTLGATAEGVLVQGNGAILVAGTYSYGTDWTHNKAVILARLNSNGQLDATFGNTGQLGASDGSKGLAINPSRSLLSGFAIAQAANGDYLAAGTAGGPGDSEFAAGDDFGVAAFLPGGLPDVTFGANGISRADLAGVNDRAFAIAIQSDGKIVVAGPGASNSFQLDRFLPPNTKIGSFTANPNPVAAGSSVSLVVWNILNSNPTSGIAQVAFYQDSNGDGTLEPATDILLGYGNESTSGVWTFTFFPTTIGTSTLYTLAQDNNGVFSDPVAITLTVT